MHTLRLRVSNQQDSDFQELILTQPLKSASVGNTSSRPPTKGLEVQVVVATGVDDGSGPSSRCAASEAGSVTPCFSSGLPTSSRNPAW